MAIRFALGQLQELDDDTAALATQLGLSSIQFNTPRLPETDGMWQTADLRALRQRCEAAGLTLEALENVPAHFLNKVVLGLPGWEEQLDKYCQTIEHVGEAGISTLGYNFMGLGVWRTSMESAGRGGALVSSFDADLVQGGNRARRQQAIEAPRRSAEEMWANYRRFLEAALPAAERAGVRLALHPDDPPIDEINGVARLFTSPANLKQGYELSGGSPAWGLDLCLGTTSSMRGGARAVEEAIDYFGPRGRIFYVHFRDVQGTVPRFQECFLGEGNYQPLPVMQRLIARGFDGFILDDHVPHLAGDTSYGHRARSHALGFLQATLAAALTAPGT